MRILIISQYFWPENFKINDIALGLVERGHQVSVLTGLPNYPLGKFFKGYSFFSKDENWEGINIYRCKIIPRGKGGIRLFINYLSFVLFAKWKVKSLKQSFDTILVYMPSPVTVGLPAITASKLFNVPYYFWVQDLWPESLRAAGKINNRLILNLFEKITKKIYHHSKKVLVQSNGFKQYIENQGICSEKIVFLPNTTESFYGIRPLSLQHQLLLPSGFKVVFAGNFGKAQGLQTLMEAAEIIKNKDVDIKWVFLGDGRYRENLENIIKNKALESNVFLLGSFPATEMPAFFALADVLIVSLRKSEIFSLTIPSKLQSYMACGKPIIASLDGEGAKIVSESGAGFSSPAEDAETLAKIILKMYYLTEEERKEMGQNAIKYFNKNFERELLLDRLIEILNNK
ncbi:MAG TPA: glycosyltransferase family 4 protein [Niabella sp.]|nr:glycosyltransferase family 4 protein [Niabella sp.]